MHESILNFRNYRYLWISMWLVGISLLAYIWHQPVPKANGGSWLGYTLGAVAALLIVWLLLLGIRKRSYHSTMGSVRGWTSAHVYLGLSLLVIATLHSGFQFGWNVHTLAYVLMTLVILSGIWGIVVYARYPARMTVQRGETNRQAMANTITELDRECILRADAVDADMHELVVKALKTDPLLSPQRKRRITLPAALGARSWKGRIGAAYGGTLERYLTEQIAATGEHTRVVALRRLLDVVAQRRRLSEKLAHDLQMQAMMELWLYLHVPLSLAMLAALIAHIISVFFYW